MKRVVVFIFLMGMVFGAGLEPAAFCQEEAQGSIEGMVTYRFQKKVKDVLVYIEQVNRNFAPSNKLPVMDQEKMVFIPFILPVVRGQAILFRNSDSVTHNIFTPDKHPTSLKSPGITLGPRGETTLAFDELGQTTLLCSLHPEMLAYIITLQNPFFALTAPEEERRGAFKIVNVPVGEYVIKTWHSRFKPSIVSVIVEENKVSNVVIPLS